MTAENRGELRMAFGAHTDDALVMDYQTAHARLEHHQLAVIAGLLLAFVIAAVLMFVHPTASLAVFAIAFVGLLASLVLGAWLGHVERAAARESLSHGACPRCGSGVQHMTARPDDWHCNTCGADFTPAGIEVA